MKHIVLNREFGIVRTVAVFGPGRGGTSVIAGCLRALGVCMGIAPHAYKHEWSPIVRQAGSKIDLPRTHQNIRRMNASYPCWGWKFPSDVFHIGEIIALLRNPGFIVVTRDLTEIALSSLTRQDVPFEISLHHAAIISQYIANRIQFWPWPILLVPFAEALREPKTLVEILCSFLQISPGESERKQAASFVQPLTRGYRPFDAQPDQLHDFSPLKDNLEDSQKLAIDLSARYGREYSQQFEELFANTKVAADLLDAKIRSPKELAITSQIVNELDDLFRSCGARDTGNSDENAQQTGFSWSGKWRAALDQSLERLSTRAREASKEVLNPTGHYDALLRLHRTLQLLIRVRDALEGGLRRIEFGVL
jgi:Sulfotransferase family